MDGEEIIFKTTRKTILKNSIFTGVIYTAIFYLLFSYDALLPLIELIDKMGLMTITMIMCPAFILLSVIVGYGNMIINGDYVDSKEKTVKKTKKTKTKTTKRTK